MYSEKELKEIINKIEVNEMYSDLDIKERLFVITRLLNNTTDLIAPYMIDDEHDKEYVRAIIKALNILLKLEEV